jgi:tetratricopeptide (TPR) repeat protein
MKIHPYRIINLLLWLLLLLCGGSVAQTIVFPFQVHALEKKNQQWLGRAISFYVSNGLELNSVETVKDPMVQSILNNYDIAFPYVISKATCIKLSTLIKADHIIWGEVESSENPQTHNVQIKTYIIDLKNFSQKYLPLLKFHLIDFYAVQQELLKMVLDHFQKKQQQFPELNMDYHHYEMFIKSLLLEDGEKRLNLLEQVSRDIHHSDYLNLELAKCYLYLGNIINTDRYLQKISDSKPFHQSKEFILGLVYYHNNQLSRAIELFLKLRRLNIFFPETTNNLGVFFLKNNSPQDSESHFIESLHSKKDPEVYVNYIKFLIDSGKNQIAKENLKKALFYFPDDEDLIKLFGYFLSREKNQKQLFLAFQKTIPQLIPTDTLPDLGYKIKNPFEIQTADQYEPGNADDTITLDHLGKDIDLAFSQIQELMELNPFVPRWHRILSKIYLKKNNRPLSQLYTLSAEFLQLERKSSQ